MSTSHPLFTDERKTQLDIDEHSCLFDLDLYNQSNYVEDQPHELVNLTPEQVVDIAIKMIQVACYTEGRELHERALQKLKEIPY